MSNQRANRLLKKAHLSASGGLARSRGAAMYEPSTPRTSPGTHPTRMGDAALHLDLFEQPGGKRVFQHPARRDRRVGECSCRGAHRVVSRPKSANLPRTRCAATNASKMPQDLCGCQAETGREGRRVHERPRRGSSSPRWFPKRGESLAVTQLIRQTVERCCSGDLWRHSHRLRHCSMVVRLR